MPRLIHALPKYHKHAASGQAIVELSGRTIYLGPHGTKASKAEYDRVIAQWLAAGRRLPPKSDDVPGRTVTELCLAFWQFAQQHYQNSPSHLDHYKRTLRHLRQLHRAYGEAAGVRVARKHIGWYLEGRPQSTETRRQLVRAETADEQFRLLDSYFSRPDTGARRAA